MTSFSDHIPIPPTGSFNVGLAACQQSTMLKVLGTPGKLTEDCSDPTGAFMARVRSGFNVGPFRVTGLDYAVESLLQIFTEVKADNSALFEQVKNEGMLCVRHRRNNPNIFSNHSWGTAIDLYFGADVMPQGTHLAERGVVMLVKYFNRHGWCWGGGFSGDSVDSMHFELADETVLKMPSQALQFSANVQSTAVAASKAVSPGLSRILDLAQKSPIATYEWLDRGAAPIGYIKGMAVAYARTYLKLKALDPLALDIAAASSGDDSRDALAWYTDRFAQMGLDNKTAGADTLRHLFVLMTGLGMRESSGNYFEGRDTTAKNPTANSAEAGLFQTSWDLCSVSTLLAPLLAAYSGKTDLLAIFSEGTHPDQQNLDNTGSGDGATYQALAKSCPAFAVEFAAVGLRHGRKNWGPINRKEAEVKAECDEMLMEVQDLVETDQLTLNDLNA